MSRRLVPGFDGAFLSRDSKDALWDKFYTAAPPTMEAIRRGIQNSQEGLRALAKRWDQPKDCREVEAARDRRRSPDRPPRSQVDRPFHRGGGDHRRFPAAYAAAARRLPLCAAADHPASDAVIPASLPLASRHQPIAAGRWQQAFEENV
jgi:hypothetical protein